jgi:hypothetical protein
MRTNLRAAVQVVSTLPTKPRSSDWFAARIIDKSRGGLGLLHCQQLYPRERIRIVAQEGVMQQAEVVWCQRVSDNCYHVGCSYTLSDAAP